MRVIAIEEHWTTVGIDRALRAQPAGARDESVALNDRGDISERLLDIGEQRIEEMAAAGVNLQILSIARPGTHGLPPREAVARRSAEDRLRQRRVALWLIGSALSGDADCPDTIGVERLAWAVPWLTIL